MPCSRFNRQFNEDTLPRALKYLGIASEYMADLGGLCGRRTKAAVA